jgi:hypothetical protein
MAQIAQCTGDAIVSPAAILTGHADDEFGDLRSDGRSTRIEAVPGAIEFRSDELAKPGEVVSGLAAEAAGSSPRRPSCFANDG